MKTEALEVRLINSDYSDYSIIDSDSDSGDLLEEGSSESEATQPGQNDYADELEADSKSIYCKYYLDDSADELESLDHRPNDEPEYDLENFQKVSTGSSVF